MPIAKSLNDFTAWSRMRPSEARIIAEGDSWFAYPVTNIIIEMNREANDKPVIFQKAEPGDEAATMLSGSQRHDLIENLSYLKQQTDQFASVDLTPHFILFSGGGNDIVGMFDFPMLIRAAPQGSNPGDFIRMERFRNRREQIRLAYIELGFIRDEFFPSCPIITHVYDYPIPSDKGAEIFGLPVTKSWMKPYLDGIGITDPDDQKGIARFVIEEFGNMLTDLQQQGTINHFHVIPTAGVLGENDWQNEIHPSPAGFRVIANMFRDKMKQLRPDLANRL
jgi:hypothetical protein